MSLAPAILAHDVVEHEVLRDDHVALHAHHSVMWVMRREPSRSVAPG